MKDIIYRPNTVQAPKLIAHRGFAVDAPQNSIPAFTKAGKLGFWAIETDVHATKDGVLVCNHDANIDSMYNGSGSIADMTYLELSKYRFRETFGIDTDEELGIPTFDQYLSICKEYGAIPFIETKTEDTEAVLSKAAEYFSEDEIIVSSLVLKHLTKVREISPRIFIHHIFSTPETMHALGENGNCGVSYNYLDLSAIPCGLIEDTHTHGVCLCLRAGDTPQLARKMIDLGLDYIPTNCTTNEQVGTYE